MTLPDPAPLDAALAQGLQSLGLDVTAQQRQQLMAHLMLIVRWNRVYNLTAVREPADMVTQHLLDSLAVAPALRRVFAKTATALPGFGAPLAGPADFVSTAIARGSSTSASAPPPAPALPQPVLPAPPNTTAEGEGPPRLLDVGSGAGLPGVPWAILHPAWSVTCVDAVAKKAGFVRQVAAELGLRNLQAEHRRVEDWQPAQSFSLIASRAFASLPDFVALTRHLLAPQGLWMALKGHPPEDELAGLPADIDVFHVEPLAVPGLNARRCLVWMRKRN